MSWWVRKRIPKHNNNYNMGTKTIIECYSRVPMEGRLYCISYDMKKDMVNDATWKVGPKGK